MRSPVQTDAAKLYSYIVMFYITIVHVAVSLLAI